MRLLEAGWRRGGFSDSDEERQLREKARAALTRYHERLGEGDARAALVRALVQLRARAKPHPRPGRPHRRAARRRLRADRLQDRRPQARRAASRRRAARALRGRRPRGLADRGDRAQLLLRARRRARPPRRDRRRAARGSRRPSRRSPTGSWRRPSNRPRHMRSARCASTGSPARRPRSNPRCCSAWCMHQAGGRCMHRPRDRRMRRSPQPVRNPCPVQPPPADSGGGEGSRCHQADPSGRLAA